ncbi:hypothetical protein ACIRD3_39865 [Kitasatospora sp. NPDC093550]|uniref:hypothetical protein n=1 Tax=Kitasatospora sp. NPDC093550 TaxID=3364089 RepID=UPI0037F7929D
MDNDQPRADHGPADVAPVGDPFADGRNMLWLLDGFDAEDELRYSRELDREEYLRVRPLFEGAPEVRLGEDVWMVAGDYRVPPRLLAPLGELLGPPAPVDGLDHFIGARQDFPDGWEG